MASYIPYSRRRITAAQRGALEQMFDVKSHPSREERLALATEIGMEVKSVTNWFQNRRQTNKRRSSAWDGNEALRQNRVKARAQLKSSRSAGNKPSLCRSARPMRPSVSLDHIAELSERPSAPSLVISSVPNRPPLTPRKANTSSRPPLSNARDIWKYMASSPIAPQSSPGAEEARMAILPSRAKTWRSLEWACLKARRGNQGDDDDELPCLPHTVRFVDSDGDTDTSESDEAITPDSSVNLSPHGDFSPKALGSGRQRKNKENEPFIDTSIRQSQDVEAAMVLLGFMGRK
ncbi:homeobox-domain-containing protein [Leucogyrophana mollusca]|uniref:Homeobox-domain-containing protein n=1 Tax=Leucogyrophana mollusca TaxID=85980 RepID=A0ACB8BNI9_9AGAM|nr:homeobox-domain-containing protein [Leucogyrophana mollusca]